MTPLPCTHCGSTDTFICTAKEAAHATGDHSFTSSPCGCINPEHVIKIFEMLSTIADFIKGLWRHKDKEQLVVICKGCGEWRWLDKAQLISGSSGPEEDKDLSIEGD